MMAEMEAILPIPVLIVEDDEWLEWTNEDGESFDEVSEL